MGGKASHHFLWPNLCAAVRSAPLPHPGLHIQGGSVNYKLMATSTDAQANGEWERFLALLAEQRKHGHLSLVGPKGAATEAGSPDPHYPFNALAVLGAWRAARRSGPPQAANACERWVGAELALAREFLVDGERCMVPATRVKDEKGQTPVSYLRDVLVAILDQRYLPGPAGKASSPWWRSDYALAALVLREILSGPKGGAIRERLLAAPLPKLFLPIHRARFPEGGYLAWLEDTPEARAAGLDVCNFVEVRPPVEAQFGFNWAPLPELPSEGREEVIGREV